MCVRSPTTLRYLAYLRTAPLTLRLFTLADNVHGYGIY
jgi:hypothetical protein